MEILRLLTELAEGSKRPKQPIWCGYSIQKEPIDSFGYANETTSGVLDLDLSGDSPRLVPMEVRLSVLDALRTEPDFARRGPPCFIRITVPANEGVGLRHPGIKPGNGKITAEVVREAAERIRNPLIHPVSDYDQPGKKRAYLSMEIIIDPEERKSWRLGMSMSPSCMLSQWIGFNVFEWRDKPGRNALGETLPYWVSDYPQQARKIIEFLSSFIRFAVVSDK